MKSDLHVPSHVPPERIVDIDIYNIPGADKDLHLAWLYFQEKYPYRILWSTRNGGHWIATRGSDIANIYSDHANYSSNITIVPKKWGEKFPLRPTTMDPPEHRPYRKLMIAALTRNHVKENLPEIRKIIVEAIDKIHPLGQCEFISDVAINIPTKIFLKMAALPETLAESLPRYNEPPNASEKPVMDRYADFLRPWVAKRQANPGDDLLSRLVRGELDGHRISEDEAIEVSTAMLTGGIDTVISLLGFIMAFLAQNSDIRRQLEERSALKMSSVVEEFVRRFPIMTKARLIKSDQVLDGVRLKAGDMIVLPPLHGVDPKEFEAPLSVIFDRPVKPNITFGYGVHLCPGKYLAQKEIELFLIEWMSRIPNFQLNPTGRLRMSSGILGAMLELDLNWDSR